jgi:DNA polymerase-3 subunit alpha
MEVGKSLLIKTKFDSFTNKEGKEVNFLRVNSLDLLADLREKRFKQLIVRMRMQDVTPKLMDDLSAVFAAHQGSVKLHIKLFDEQEKLQVDMRSRSIRVNPENALLEVLEKMPLVVELSE